MNLLSFIQLLDLRTSPYPSGGIGVLYGLIGLLILCALPVGFIVGIVLVIRAIVKSCKNKETEKEDSNQ